MEVHKTENGWTARAGATSWPRRRQEYGGFKMEYWVDVPAITVDTVQLFLLDDGPQLESLESELFRQEADHRRAWESAITAPGFTALQFVQRGTEYPITLILHPSTRAGVDWQLSRIGYDGIPIGHGEYNLDDMESLYHDLEGYAYNGCTVQVLCV